MDDLSSGAPETNTGYELYLQSKLRLAEGGFNLRTFVSNSPELTNRIQCNESRNSRSDAGTSSKAAEPKSVQPPRAYPERNVVSEDKTYVKSMLGTIEEKNSSVLDLPARDYHHRKLCQVCRIQVQSCPCERIIHSKIRASCRSSIS